MKIIKAITIAVLILMIVGTLVATVGCGTKYSLTISATGQGTTNPAAGTYTYSSGQSVTISATPASGWQFHTWSGDASGTTATATVTMDANKSVVAKFDEPFTYSLNIGLSSGSYPLNLSVGDEVDFSFTVVGSQVWYNVQDPNSNIILTGSGGSKVMAGNGTFTAATSGVYLLYFESSGIITSSGVEITGTIYPAS